jgi:hypothetical protein
MISRELLAELEPIDRPIQFAANSGEVTLVDKDQRLILSLCSMAPCRHAQSSFVCIMASCCEMRKGQARQKQTEKPDAPGGLARGGAMQAERWE